MAEYIEREEAIKTLLSPITMSMCLSVEECRHKQDQMFIDVGLVKSVPAADVQPVRHGRWILKAGEDWYGGGGYECSACKYGYAIGAYHEPYEFTYCPNCGAKMDGGEE